MHRKRALTSEYEGRHQLNNSFDSISKWDQMLALFAAAESC